MSISTADWAIIGSAFVLGLRHGVDHDHIAALTDITSLQKSPTEGLSLSGLYVLAHSLVVMLLGVLAVVLGIGVPARLDLFMGRAVGVTLFVLGLLVVSALLGTKFRQQQPPTMGRLALQSLLAIATFFKPKATLKHSRASNFKQGPGSVVIMGAVHGIGAETPSQLLLFVLASGFTSAAVGIFIVGVFVGGLLLTNAAMSLVLAVGFGSILRRPWVYRSMLMGSAVYSVATGIVFMSGLDSRLPHVL